MFSAVARSSKMFKKEKVPQKIRESWIKQLVILEVYTFVSQLIFVEWFDMVLFFSRLASDSKT